MTCAYFVSDLHLSGAENDGNSRIFLSFLKSLRTQPSLMGEARTKSPTTHLFLVGDIFDLWVGDHIYFQKKFADIISEIRSLVHDGVEIHYFEGNHDFHLVKFWEDEIGVKVHPDVSYFQLAQKTVRVEHGDLINPEDRGYLFLRRFFRTAVMRHLALNLPASLVRSIGERASHKSRSYNSLRRNTSSAAIRKMIHDHAEKVAEEKPFDLMISGHLHIFDDYTFSIRGKNEASARSVNLGSWFDGAKALRLTESTLEMMDLGSFSK